MERIRVYVHRQIVHNLNDLQRISIYYHELDRLTEDRRKSVIGSHRHDRFLRDLIKQAQEEGQADATSMRACSPIACSRPSSGLR